MSTSTLPPKPAYRADFDLIRANFPENLRGGLNWLTWQYEEGEKRWEKIPYSARDGWRHGNTTNPMTWLDFERAAKRCAFDKRDGVGFVLTLDDAIHHHVAVYITGVDLDGCRDPQTGEIAAWARKIINHFNSYTEVSPSGEGVHIYLRGITSRGRKRAYGTGKIEVYSYARYFTVTGDHVEGTPHEVRERGPELEEFMAEYFTDDEDVREDEPVIIERPPQPNGLADEALLAKARQAKNGREFTTLYDQGDLRDFEDDASRADWWLACSLAWWTGRDIPRMDRLFRSSALYREKWAERHYSGGETYGQRTLANAANATSDSYQEPGKQREERHEERREKSSQNGAHPDPEPEPEGDAGEEKEEKDEPTPLLGVALSDVTEEAIDWLWRGYVALRKLVMFDGEPGKGKSLVTLDLAARVAMGNVMPDKSAGLAEPAGVLIVCGEDGLADTVKPRLLAAGASPDALQRVRAVNLIPVKTESGEGYQRLLSLVTDLLALEKTITGMKAKLLIIDPITAYLGDKTDIYKDSDIRRVLTPVALMAERCGVAVVLVRHFSKNTNHSAMNRGLGGVAFIGIARLGLLFADNPQEEGERLMGRYKGNIGAPPPTQGYKIVQVGELENHVKIEWLGPRKIDIEMALAQEGERAGALKRAMRFIRDELKDGDVSANDMFDRGEDEGFSKSTMNRAKKKLGVDSKKVGEGKDTHWVWLKIPDDDEESQGSQGSQKSQGPQDSQPSHNGREDGQE
jgi:hypothetical protein